MTRKGGVFFGKSFVALTLLLGAAPVFLMLGAALAPGRPDAWYLLPCAAYLLGAVSYLVPDKRRAAWTAFAALALAAAGFFLLLPLGGAEPFALLLAALIFLFLLPPAYRKPLGGEWSLTVWSVCLIAHLIANLYAANNALFHAVRAPLNAAFALFLLCGALLINHMSLRGGMGGDARPPKAIRRRNMLATALMYLLALIAAMWDTVARALNAAVDFVKYVFFMILDFIAGLFPTGTTRNEGGGEMDLSALLGGDKAEPSAFARILEKILTYAALALGVAAALFCLYFLGKKLWKLLKRLLARLRAYASAVGEAYTDQSESTFHLDKWTRSARGGLEKIMRRRARPTPWKLLDGRARVRRLYGDYLRRRPAAPADTARETLLKDKQLSAASEFAALYDRARYSAHEVDPADADALRARVTGGTKA